jgi:RNA polymerase sigma-70 factor, ECF subfamily
MTQAAATDDVHCPPTTWVLTAASAVAGAPLTRNTLVTDEDLSTALRDAIDGNAGGFAVLWRALNPPLLRYLSVVCADAAEDVASETWLHVAQDLSAFRGDEVSFRVWLFRIARHRGIDENRRAWRHREQVHGAVETLGEGTLVRDISLDVIETSETARALELIKSLPAHQAEAVMLRVVAGLDVAGTAAVLGKRAGAVRIAAMRGLRRLAEHPQIEQFGRLPGTGTAGRSTTLGKDGRA